MRRIRRAFELAINQLLRRTPTLVFSAERTGSIALIHSLQSHGVFVIGAHCLDPKKLATQRHSGSARWACKHIIDKRSPVRVISLVRHPIENMLSTYARADFGKLAPGQAGEKKATESVSPDQLRQDFVASYLETSRYQKPLNWFTDEFQAALGIDVYAHPFDAQKGFARFQDGPYVVLLLRTELKDSAKAELVGDFLDIPALTMTSAEKAPDKNRRLPPGKPGDQTEYADKYKTLKQVAAFPNRYLDEILKSQFVEHFFTAEERATMRKDFATAVAT